MKVLLNACLLCALLSAVAPLRCLQCVGPPKHCSSNSVEVDCGPHEDTCISGVMEGSLLGRVTLYTIQDCVQSRACVQGLKTAAAVNGLYILANYECCQTNLCNREIPKVPPPGSLLPNGLRCPACIALAADDCESDDTVACVGMETECGYLGAVLVAAHPISDFIDMEIDLAVRGCASPSACLYRPGSMEWAGGMLTMNFTHLRCQSAYRNTSNNRILLNPPNTASYNDSPIKPTEG
uniref:Phospholipase A2 inhibitor and Ly6/PLAUR domain-containing protein-like n=1 Tax=Pogona vitticeps TaxID=103695 RepID=A0ABM5ET43_9SAUR